MVRKLKNLLLSFLRWYAPFFFGRLLLELVPALSRAESYASIKVALTVYLLLVVVAFAWRLYDGLYRTGDLLWDERDFL